MIITWLGHSCFKIQTANALILVDPYEASIGFKLPKVNPDLLLITHDHTDHSNIAGVGGAPYIVKGPGEYEARGVFVQGVPAFHDNVEGKERGMITMYRIEADDLRLAHLGDLGQHKLTDEQFEQLNGADILFIPVGGTYTLDAKSAVEIITQLEPRIVIPMHYRIPGLDAKRIPIAGIEAFAKQMGISPSAKEEKLKIAKKDLPQEETQVIILKPA